MSLLNGSSQQRDEDDVFVPAAGRRGLTSTYDLAIALTMRERRFRGDLTDRVLAGSDGQPLEIVDVGSGTGTLAIALAERGARVEALDGDPDVLERAQAKPGAQRVRWHEARADALPLADASCDRVVCSLVLHHLSDTVKHAALREALRVLRPGGRLHVADWGAPRDLAMRAAFRLLQAVDGRANTQSHADGLIPGFIGSAGFAEVTVDERLRTAWGQLELISAIKPSV
jgi:ubiquinone/menaquinone biosynthesis C-methylase UbiE